MFIAHRFTLLVQDIMDFEHICPSVFNFYLHLYFVPIFLILPSAHKTLCIHIHIILIHATERNSQYSFFFIWFIFINMMIYVYNHLSEKGIISSLWLPITPLCIYGICSLSVHLMKDTLADSLSSQSWIVLQLHGRAGIFVVCESPPSRCLEVA